MVDNQTRNSILGRKIFSIPLAILALFCCVVVSVMKIQRSVGAFIS